MKNRRKKLLLQLFSPLIGKTHYQRIFETLHLFTLVGMNFGMGTDSKNSGEKNAIQYVINKTGSTDLTVFDVGAHIGNYTVLLLKLLRENSGVHALIYLFEPSKTTFKRLKKRFLNELPRKNLRGIPNGQVLLSASSSQQADEVFARKNKKNIYFHNFGFGERNKYSTLFYDKEESELASLYKRRLKHYGIQMEQNENVRIKTIDSFCSENKINRVHLLKLDVEGNELEVIKGASNMIKSNAIDFIQFEFGGCNIDSRTYFQDFYYLLSPDFKIYRILKNGLYPISSYKETQEIFITTNYLAERKI